MPLKITPADPFATPFGIPIASVYATIDVTTYVRRTYNMSLEVEYYYSEADCKTGQPLPIDLPRRFSLLVPAEDTNQPNLTGMLEQFVASELGREYGERLSIALVP